VKSPASALPLSLRRQAEDLQPLLQRLRRHIHCHPELSGAERQTATLIKNRLAGLGLEVQETAGGTGVVGLLDGAKTGRVVALRADTDALPIMEQNDVEYASAIPGVMHACGHDAHVSCLLGAAMILNEHRDDLAGSVKFIFQPAEESDTGAAAMIDAGVLESVEAIFGLHTFPRLAPGTIGLRTAGLMASIDTLRIRVLGSSGHGAAPHQASDAVVAAASVVLNLQTIVSRKVNPTEAAVVSIGRIQGGSAANVIAPEVELLGTIRARNEQTREHMRQLVRQVADGTCAALGTTAEVTITANLPVLNNDPEAVARVAGVATRLYGAEAVREAEPTLGGDDFSLYLEHVPGCYFWLGTAPGGGRAVDWHQATYDIDETALSVGASLLAGCAYSFLTEQ